jgi:hypothetical protein
MKTTPNLAIPYPEPGDSTRTWEYWQGMAERIDAIFNGGFAAKAGSIVVGDPTAAAAQYLGATNLQGSDVWLGRMQLATGGVDTIQLLKNGVEVNRLRINPDGSISAGKTGSPVFALPRAQLGRTGNIGPTNAGNYQLVVTFPAVFPAVPKVFANMAAAPGPSGGWSVRAMSESASGFTIFMTGIGTVETFTVPVDWFAAIP